MKPTIAVFALQDRRHGVTRKPIPEDDGIEAAA
jgi:hypothetical protein